MKTKISKRILVIICIITLILPISLEVLAKITNSSVGSKQNFGISLMHTSKKLNGELGIGFGYRVDTKNAYRIYSGSDNEEGYEDTVLCLDRNGKFPKEEDSTNQGVYTSLGEATESTLNQAKSSINTQDTKKIQWLIKNALIPEDSDDLKDQKLAQIFGDLMKSTESNENPVTLKEIKRTLTEDDIVFALQCAIWEITNDISGYTLLGTSDNGGTWDGLEGNDKWGYRGVKGTYIRQIINYYRAHANDNTNEGTTPKTDPTFDDSKTVQTVISGAYAFIGPFKINPATNYYSIDISFQNISGAVQNNVSYVLTDKPSNQNVKILAQTKEDLEGKDFYIRVRTTTSARKAKIRLVTQISTSASTGTVWTDGDVRDQPLLSIKREETPGKEIEKEEEFEVVLTKEYDASLRKYITAIRRKKTTQLGHEVTETINLADNGKTRIPQDILKPATGQEPFNQYVYNHRKDPVEVQVDDLVIYTIRITNECKNTMIIKSITDYLPPSGIEFVAEDDINSNNSKWNWTYTSSNRSAKAINKKNSQGWILDPGQHEDIQIVCRVTEDAKGKVVTNIAEITEIADEHGDPVEDIDSEPHNVKLPKEEKEWEDYKGNEGTAPDGFSDPRYKNKDELADRDYYYKGQQDDDDFEKVIVKIPSQEYDLEIVKVDKNDETKLLENAQFEVTYPDGSKEIVKTGSNGKIKTKKIGISGSGTDNIRIVEKVAPTGYDKLIGGLDVWIDKTVENGVYKVKEARVTSILEGCKVSLNGNTITITIPNEREKPKESEYEIEIIKIDKDDPSKKLAGAEFEITLSNGTKKKVVTGDNGVATIQEIGISKTGKDTIKLTETKAPKGYTKLIESLEIEVNVELKDGQYKVTSTNLKNSTTAAKVEVNNNKVTATIQNKSGVYDLALKKFITSLTTANGTNKIIPDNQKRKLEVTNVDSLVNRTDDGKADATYKLNKTPVDVVNGDYVTYTIRVFNEGTVDAKVKEIVDTVPKGLEFVPYETNSDGTYKSGSKTNYTYKWEVFKDKNTETGWKEGVRTRYLENKNSIPAFDKTKENEENKELGLSYADVKIEFKVNLSNLTTAEKEEILKNGIKNIAEITDDDGDDNDSTPDDKDPEEDDEDYDVVVPKEFDLALRKFITKINETDVTDRIPKVTYTNGKIKYDHTKEPKIVVEGQTVIYTIRVYNEGTLDGYATEITDDLPKGITFLPKHEINTKYEWKMYDQSDNETNDVSKAVKIKTRYLSRDKSVDNLLKAFDRTKPISDTNPAYKEVKVAFEVTQNSVTDGNKVIINTAQISEDEDKDGNPVDDVDSIPNNGKEDEDDIDKEYLVLKYFDLALLKYVSKVIVTENGVTKETETGYTGEENPERPVKVELDKKNISKTDIKYVYSIKIMNQGEIEGYATEITDRIPDGLEFYEEDNTQFNWKKTSDGTATTDYLKNTLLQPGESAIIQIVLRWRRDEGNLGQKVNVAEITEDDNPYDVPDIDSTPNNNVDGEDDQDSAIVVLSVKTGSAKIHIAFIIGIITLLAIGIHLICKCIIIKR